MSDSDDDAVALGAFFAHNGDVVDADTNNSRRAGQTTTRNADNNDNGDDDDDSVLETMLIDRCALAREGVTRDGFVVRYDILCNNNNNNNNNNDDEKAEEGTVCAADVPRVCRLQPAALTVYFRRKRHSLWGHRLWNAAKYLAKRIDERRIDVRGRAVLELGAGLGVPSLVACRNGAACVVATDYPDEQLLDVLRRNVAANGRVEDVDADVTLTAAPHYHVEPLLWGKEEHIRAVLRHTAGGNTGYDVVLLSDILFNHVCNSDLADTVARTLRACREATAYCVFSHHRAHKQLHDLQFFDLCAARGLHCVQVDEEDYPLMFADDRGPVEVRQPVRCYTLRHVCDAAGLPLDVHMIHGNNSNSSSSSSSSSGAKGGAAVDVVVQGTGLAQSLLAAALARSGVRVLHCDAQAHYGGVHVSVAAGEFAQHVTRLADRARETYTQSGCADDDDAADDDVCKPCIVVDTTQTALTLTERRQCLVDVLPLSCMADGATVRALVRADMARTLEFQNVSCLCVVQDEKEKKKESTDDGNSSNNDTTTTTTPPLQLCELPMTRAAVFASSRVPLHDKRRIMRLVKDVVASTLAEQLHARDASPADDPAYTPPSAAAAATTTSHAADAPDTHDEDDGDDGSGDGDDVPAFVREAAASRALTLRTLLRQRYALDGDALDAVTLLGQVDVDDDDADTRTRTPRVVRAMRLLRCLWRSVGVYEGVTPYLMPVYGAGELPQHMCRTAAVWGGVYVLRRAVCRVVLDAARERQWVVLSNGQHIAARVLVTPRETASLLLQHVQPPPPSSVSVAADATATTRAAAVRWSDWRCVLQLEAQRASGALARAQATALHQLLRRSNNVDGGNKNTEDDDDEDGGDARDVRFARVVLVTRRRPLLSWATLRTASADANVCDEKDDDACMAPPLVMALARVPSSYTRPRHTNAGSNNNSISGGSDEDSGAVVHIVQHTLTSEQMPSSLSGGAIAHFTADATRLSHASLLQWVQQRVLPTWLPHDNNSGSSDEEDGDNVVLLVGYTISAVHAALASHVAQPLDTPSETRHTHAYALDETARLQAVHDRTAGTTSVATATADTLPSFLSVVTMPTLRRSLLDDGAYVRSARAAYAQVVARLHDSDSATTTATPHDGSSSSKEGGIAHTPGARQRYIFLERQPPLPAL